MIIPPGALITDKAEQILDTQMYGLGRQWREAQAAVW